MSYISAESYRELMTPWLKALPRFLRCSQFNPELTYYGTGESAHWAVQSNCNVFAALAVMGETDTALALLRYTLRTHLTGDASASDGRQWGNHWISVLGLERMAHGVNIVRDQLTEDDLSRLRKMTLSEADFLLEEYPVVAGIPGPENRPESNIWNGGFLMRAALDYPGAPNAERYLEKATRFLINGISYPSDVNDNTIYNGKSVREWHVGPNFTDNFSLDHHSYLNVGYMVICLSNIAMLHFNFKERGQASPPEIYHNLEKLWALVKKLTFVDGRLLRIGGDTRARYTYCQDYAVPAWLLAVDLFHDTEAVGFEHRWLEQVRTEAEFSGDGGFYSKRLDNIRENSYYYFCRLESDRILSLSYGAYWRGKFQLQESLSPVSSAAFEWDEKMHGATLFRDERAIRSWVHHGGQGATGVCVPPHRSDMAEWQRNLCGELITPGLSVPEFGEHAYQTFSGGFLNIGNCRWQERAPLGEGEEQYYFADQKTVAAALPDGRTILLLDYAVMTKEITLKMIKGLNLKIPNDLFNHSHREYKGGNFSETLKGCPNHDDTRIINSNCLTIDDELSVLNIYGSETLTIHRPFPPSIIIKKAHAPWLHSLYADEICSVFDSIPRRYLPGTVVIDCGYAISADSRIGIGCKIKHGIEYMTPEGEKYQLLIVSPDEASGKLLAEVENISLWKLE